MKTVIAASGLGTRFKKDGWLYPKPLILCLGRPMISLVIENLQTKPEDLILIMLREHVEKFKLREYFDPKITLVELEKPTSGAAETFLLSENLIDPEESVLFANSDQYINYDLTRFYQYCNRSNIDCGVLTFTDTDKKWSYAKTTGIFSLQIEEIREKQTISTNATCGLYWFKKSKFIYSAIREMIAAKDFFNGEPYLAPAINYLIKNGLMAAIFNIEKENMFGTGTPKDMEYFVNSFKGQYNGD